MTNYQALIKKLQLLRKTYCPTVRYDFTPSELELIADALETIQFLEIILKSNTSLKMVPLLGSPQSGIRVKSPDYYPCLTYIPNIPIIYDHAQQKYRYLNQAELLSLQSFPVNYQFPENYSLTKIASLLGNSINLTALHHFLPRISNLKFVDLFCGIGGFHLVLKRLENNCVLAVDINKNSQATYQLNFPLTPFLLGDINHKKIQQQIIKTDFDLLCAGFPCQPYSRAGPTTQGVRGQSKSGQPEPNRKRPTSKQLLARKPSTLGILTVLGEMLSGLEPISVLYGKEGLEALPWEVKL
ncbi:11080_t:CDS:2, partial [Ambispora leptoticha]